MATSKPSIPKGTRDFGPVQSARRSYVIEIIKRNFRRYGFQPIETPSMENLSVLTGKYGEEGDQLLFKILNSGDYLSKASIEDYNKGSQHLLSRISEKGLRYDLTVPFARYVVQHQHEINFPFKRYQIQPVWRADRPQKGRYREFYQCDADIVGTSSLWNEAELTMLVHDVFNELGYNNFTLKINHRAILNGLATYSGLQGKEMAFCISLDKIDKIGEENVTRELIELGGHQDEIKEIMDLIKSPQSINEIDKISHIIGDNDGIDALREYFNYLNKYNQSPLNVEIDFSLARGLTYYTGMIFEVKANDVAIGSITGGGRYDNLTGVFGMEGISGVGISFGLDRIYDVLDEKGLFPDTLSQPADIMIAHFDQESFEHGIGLLYELRSKGINADIYPEPVKIKKQFNYANKSNIPFVLVIGTEEIRAKKYSLKNLENGSQEMLSIEKVVEQLSTKF